MDGRLVPFPKTEHLRTISTNCYNQVHHNHLSPTRESRFANFVALPMGAIPKMRSMHKKYCIINDLYRGPPATLLKKQRHELTHKHWCTKILIKLKKKKKRQNGELYRKNLCHLCPKLSKAKDLLYICSIYLFLLICNILLPGGRFEKSVYRQSCIVLARIVLHRIYSSSKSVIRFCRKDTENFL